MTYDWGELWSAPAPEWTFYSPQKTLSNRSQSDIILPPNLEKFRTGLSRPCLRRHESRPGCFVRLTANRALFVLALEIHNVQKWQSMCPLRMFEVYKLVLVYVLKALYVFARYQYFFVEEICCAGIKWPVKAGLCGLVYYLPWVVGREIVAFVWSLLRWGLGPFL